MRKFGFGLIALAATALIAACGHAPPPCVDEMSDQVYIYWGTTDSSGTTSGYLMRSNGFLYSISAEGITKIYQTEKIGPVEGETYCKLRRGVELQFLEDQTLFSPGKSYNFVDYRNQKTGVSNKAVWNPEHKTLGSIGFRELFDELNSVAAEIE